MSAPRPIAKPVRRPLTPAHKRLIELLARRIVARHQVRPVAPGKRQGE